MSEFFGFMLAVFVISFVLIVGTLIGYDYGYKYGQIDAINGNIVYQLEVHDNGSSSWEEIKEK